MRAHLTALRLLLLRLHFYAGLLVGPFVLVTALTGLLFTAAPQLESAVYDHELRVPVGARRVPLADQVSSAQASARATLHGDTILAVRPAAAPADSTEVVFGAAAHNPDRHEHTVFVDPYTNAVRGTLTSYGEWLPIQAWLVGLHRDLHLGDVGRMYSELAASWLLVLAVSGSALWTARTRRRRRLRRLLLPTTRGTGRRRLQSWHGVIGLWAMAGLVLVSGTGLAWSQFAGANVTALHAALHWTEPTVQIARRTAVSNSAGAPGSTAVRDAGTVSRASTAQHVLDAARGSGLNGPVEIRPAPRPGDAWVVQQTRRQWPTRLDEIAVDPATGVVLQRVRFADWPLPAKIARWTADMHAGLLFGAIDRALLAVLSFGVVCLVIWGYRMWWLRARYRGGWARAPGASIRPTLPAVLALAVLGVVAGLVLPLLGISVLGFLLLDSLVVASGGQSAPTRDVAAILSMQESPPAGDT
ncbi:MAG TPA: PepSY-associated TM helix domain-containing protein [Pseudonocardiaceae bacterium]